MEALLILDLQKGMIKNGDYRDTLDNIENLIEMFVKEEKLIISFKHIDENMDSSIYKESDGADFSYKRSSRHHVEMPEELNTGTR